MENQTASIESEVNGQPFIITSNVEDIQDLEQQQRQYAVDMAKSALMAPFRAVGRIASQVVAEIEVDIYDRRFGTNFREVITAERLKRQHEAKARRISQKIFNNPDTLVLKHK